MDRIKAVVSAETGLVPTKLHGQDPWTVEVHYHLPIQDPIRSVPAYEALGVEQPEPGHRHGQRGPRVGGRPLSRSTETGGASTWVKHVLPARRAELASVALSSMGNQHTAELEAAAAVDRQPQEWHAPSVRELGEGQRKGRIVGAVDDQRDMLERARTDMTNVHHVRPRGAWSDRVTEASYGLGLRLAHFHGLIAPILVLSDVEVIQLGIGART